MASIRDFDAFRRPPSDLYERGTLGGSVLTLGSLIAVFSLVVWHVAIYVAYPTHSEELVIRQFRKDRIMISLMLDVAMPCPLVDIEVHDALGKHTLDASRNISKHRLDRFAKKLVDDVAYDGIQVEKRHDQQHDKPVSGSGVHKAYFESSGHSQLDSLGDNAPAVLKAMSKAGEWCRFNGSVAVARMPGKLFVHAHHALLKSDGDWVTEELYNTSHLIHRLRFIDVDSSLTNMVLSLHEQSGEGGVESPAFGVNPIPGMNLFFGFLPFFGGALRTPLELSRKIMDKPSINWRYDVQVVEQEYAKGTPSYTFTLGQYSYEIPAGFKDHPDHAEPLSMSYSFSPLTVVHKETYQSFMQCVVSLLASLGGSFAVLKFLDNSIFVGRHLVVKSRAGKIV